MVREIDRIPETKPRSTIRQKLYSDLAEAVDKGYRIAELFPGESGINLKYPQNVTEIYRMSARRLMSSRRDEIAEIRISIKRDADKKPHWYAEIVRWNGDD